MFWKKSQKIRDEETSAEFAKNLRAKIVDNQVKTPETRGICVFEHADERALDESEKEILRALRIAHEEWIKNPAPKADDTFQTARMRASPLNTI